MIWTVKEAIYGIIKDRILTDFQMLTSFSEDENIVNNCPLSQDHEDLEALTPNHFLIGRNFYNDCLVNNIVTRMCAAEKSVAMFIFYQIIFGKGGCMNICHLWLFD